MDLFNSCRGLDEDRETITEVPVAAPRVSLPDLGIMLAVGGEDVLAAAVRERSERPVAMAARGQLTGEN
jgi:hypothetical protein